MFNIIDRFSTHLREVLVRSIKIAAELKGRTVEPSHLLLALATQKGSVAGEFLNKYPLNTGALEKIQKNSVKNTAVALSPFSPKAKNILEKAMIVAEENGHNYLGTEHLLAALVESKDPEIENLLKQNNIDRAEIRAGLKTVMANSSEFPGVAEPRQILDQMREDMTEEIFPMSPAMFDKKSFKKDSALEFFGAELTAKEIQSDIDPVIGREQEIERMMQILCRRSKNNPILLGDPGVGKTAIVEGLAKKIMAGEAPAILQNKKIYAIDMGMLIAGTVYRGEFEARLRQIIEEASKNPDIILFIDELHNIVGAGSNQGTMDAANLLKPALARGQIRCIGATTPSEFKKHIESDPALERRFQPVYVKESSAEETEKILAGIKNNYEKYHNLRITDEAIAAAARLADRYLANKFLPDKAIDLLDETAAAKRLKISPSDREIELYKLKQEASRISREKEIAVKNEKFEEAVKLKDSEAKLAKKIKEAEAALSKNALPQSPLAVVTEKDVACQISKMTGVPVGGLLLGEKKGADAIKNLERQLKKYIIGQDRALEEVCGLITQARLELSNPNRPMASFLFVGKSGVGKTELAKTIAKALYPEQNALIQLNMSEFSESYSVSKLLGSPAGYVGYREPNQLIDRAKLNPYSIILFDEIDKAHPDVLKLLLQMLEEGEAADSTGKKVSLRRAIIILTTGAGADDAKKTSIGFGQNILRDKESSGIREIMKNHFSPELINRIDHICLFDKLAKKDLAKIAELEVGELNKRLSQYNTAVSGESEIFEKFVGGLSDKIANAREIRRKIRIELERAMAEIILQDKTRPLHKIILSKNNRLAIK